MNACVFCLLSSPLYAEPLSLEQAWINAYQHNPSLEAQRASLRAADEQVSQALSHWRPSIDANGSVGKTSQYAPDLAPFENPRFNDTTKTYGVQVTQPLFRGLRTKFETEAAEQQVLSARAKLASAEQQLFLDTASAYLGVLRDEAVLTLERGHESVLEEKLKETHARSWMGELTGTDVRQSESRLARAHVARFQAETTLTQDKAAFERLVGMKPEELKRPALGSALPSSRADILHASETGNPDVIAAQYTVEAAKAEIRLNEGSLLPEVDLVGSSSRSYGENITVQGREDSSQVLVQMTMPLYRAGTDYSKARAAEQVAGQRRDELFEARRKARETADNAWQALMTAQSAMDADKTEVDSSTEALKGVREESKVGTRTTLDVLNAEQEMLDAKIDQVKSQHDYDFALLQIQSAVGRLDAGHLKLSTAIYDPKRHYEDVKNQWIGFSKDDSRYILSSSPKP